MFSAALRRPRAPGPDGGRSLSILAVTSEPPWPLDTGGHLRTFHLLSAFARRSRVRLVTAMRPDQDDAIAALKGRGIDLIPAAVGGRSGWRECFRASAAALRGEPYVMYRRHDRSAVREAIRDQVNLERPDVFYLDHLDSLLFRGLCPATPAVLDLHNVYSRLVRRAADEQGPRGSRLYLRREARLLHQMECRAARTIDRILAVSEDEARHFQSLGARAVEVIPNGVDCEPLGALPTGRPTSPPTLLYVGSMSWGPNISAASFLATAVLPRVREHLPEARLRIVGRDPTSVVRALNGLPGVEVTGTVPDLTPHLREASLLAVPLASGGGTRLKILEAFAAGLPVVSTPIGCEGLDAVADEHLLIANLDRFADTVLALLRAPERGVQLAIQARDLARRRFDWSAIGETACTAVAATALEAPSPTP